MRNARGVVSIAAAALLLAASAARAQDVGSIVVNEFLASNQSGLADGNGERSDWVELRNPTASAVSLAGCYLTDDAANLDKWPFPPTASIPANGYLVVMCSDNATGSTPYIDALGYIHTTFKLGAGGDSIAFVAADGATVVSAYWDFGPQATDVSYGRGSNGADGFFQTPTPGAANGPVDVEGVVADTQFSAKRGFYSAPFDLAIACDTPGVTIKYTLDCSTPSPSNGTVYSAPIAISHTTVVRAMAYRTNWVPTNVDTHTYIFLADAIAQPATRPTAAWPLPNVGSSTVQAIDYEMDPDITGSATYGPMMDDALLAIPSVSIVTDLPNLFNATTGIYVNPGGEGDSWERAAAIELLNPDGAEGFHVDAGIRIRGGVSAGKRNPKHSFRVICRSEYGDSKIEYPLLGPDGPQEYDKIDFRTAQNFSWNNSSPQFATWLDDPFSRDTMRDMGHPSTQGYFYHLYLDGLYWGLYQMEERPDAFFGVSHMGAASEDDIDVVKSDEDTGEMYAVDGTTGFYFALWSLANTGFSTFASYMQAQGLNTDGTVNPAYPRYLDVDNLADYMLLVFHTGAQDMPLGPPMSNSQPRNLYAIADRVGGDGFQFLPHDNEWSLVRSSGVSYNRVTYTIGAQLGQQNFCNPWWLHNRLKLNTEYVVRFGDRVHRHFFNGGALTAPACVARYQARMDEIDLAIVAESARWGDTLSPTDPRDRNTDWLPAVQWVRDSYLNAAPQTRSTIVLNQLIAAGLYPTVAAPVFSQHGGTVTSGTGPTVTAAAGTIHYTLDGTDPRLPGGNVSPAALSGTTGLVVPLTQPSTLKARARNGSAWSAMNEAAFAVEQAPVAEGTWWAVR